MRKLRGLRLIAAIGVAALCIALVFFGVVEHAMSAVAVGALIVVAISVSVWNRRLLWAMRRESRRADRRSGRQLAVLVRHTNRFVEVEKKMREVLGELERMEARITQVDRGREARTAAQFDWLARRSREQERQLAAFLTRQEIFLKELDSRPAAMIGRRVEEIVTGNAALETRIDDAAKRAEVLEGLMADIARNGLAHEERFEQLVARTDSLLAVSEASSAVLVKADYAAQRRLLEQIRATQLMFGTRKSLLGDISALFTIYGDESPPKPTLGNWSMTPRALEALRREILTFRPGVTVELGSGSSTSFLGVWTKEACGDARVISVEHDERYLAQTRAELNSLGLDHVDLLHAPLVEQLVCGAQHKWYGDFPVPEVIDLLVVDGPPQATGENARMPAIPRLAVALRQGSRVLLDDAVRDEERGALAHWLSATWSGRRLRHIETVDTVAILEVDVVDD